MQTTLAGDEKPPLTATRASRGVCFGTESLTGMPRLTTVTAVEDATLLRFSTEQLRIDGSGAVALANRVFETFVEGELRNMNLFKGLPARVFAQVVPLFQLEEHGQADSSIFEEGDAGDKFYILLHGRVAVVKGDLTLAVLDSHAQDVHDGHPFFGEMALLDGAPRMAAIRTRTPCKMLVLSKPQFAKFLQLVSDFKHRLRRTKELRKKQSELNVASKTENYSIAAHRELDEEAQERVDEVQSKLRELQEDASLAQEGAAARTGRPQEGGGRRRRRRRDPAHAAREAGEGEGEGE